jgi:hypothetical protein
VRVRETRGWQTYVKQSVPVYTDCFALSAMQEVEVRSTLHVPSLDIHQQIKRQCQALCEGYSFMALHGAADCLCSNSHGTDMPDGPECGLPPQHPTNPLCGMGVDSQCINAAAVYSLPTTDAIPPSVAEEGRDGYLGCFRDGGHDMTGVLEDFAGFKPACGPHTVDGGCAVMAEPSYSECARLCQDFLYLVLYKVVIDASVATRLATPVVRIQRSVDTEDMNAPKEAASSAEEPTLCTTFHYVDTRVQV